MIRYPGSKDKISTAIVQRFPIELYPGGLFSPGRLEYREPFFGAGAIGLKTFRQLQPQHTVWINDRDYGVCCLWEAIKSVPDELIARVRTFTPSVPAWNRYRTEDDRRDLDIVETGFRKLALHQMSFSGLGAKAGGPIGGQQQSSSYNVNCRWNPSRLQAEIRRIHGLFRRVAAVKITAGDFAPLITDAPTSAYVYVDPPYVAKGAQLYKYAMTTADHRRLAAALRVCRAYWVLSYDDHPLVRELYDWARIESVEMTYTTAIATSGTVRRKNHEVIIRPR